jgi:alpha-galactosidase
MNRRKFVLQGGLATISSALQGIEHAAIGKKSSGERVSLPWTTSDFAFTFELVDGCLRQGRLVPREDKSGSTRATGVETALQLDNENSPDAGMKQGVGQPGLRLAYAGRRTKENEWGELLILTHRDDVSHLQVESFYQAVKGTAVVRRWTRLTNQGTEPLGLNYASSAMLHALAPASTFESELRIHLAPNSWMAEAQWQTFKASELGFINNERASWSEAYAYSVGSWSAGKYLPMAVVENTKDNLSWFWQIEHNGSWYWEISNNAERGQVADDVYAYIGGPDDLHADAWKLLKPGASHETVSVAIGCVEGGFEEAVAQLTSYRRRLTAGKVNRGSVPNPVIFNDYMNCLSGDPTEARELPMIEAAAAVGCEYYVIDAGWYAALHEDWTPTLGAWLPSTERFPTGLKFTMDKIRSSGMIPGLWLEPEVAGNRSELARTRPESWFFQRHGKRVLRNSRYMLDFRNPEVTAYLTEVVRRLVESYGVGYIKMDYNVNALVGTDLAADSPGQGLLEHNRALLRWLDEVLEAFPHLAIENCGSGGGRMDYAMLSRLQIQSMTDQEDYRRLPAILVGVTAGVLPEQIGVWSYPLADADADQASFNMVTTLTCRIHQSGKLDKLSGPGIAQVKTAISLYKVEMRQHVAHLTPFYPIGLPAVNHLKEPVVLGMRGPGKTYLSAWRLEGGERVRIPIKSQAARLLYPLDRGITVQRGSEHVEVRFPRPYMGCVLTLA